MLTEQAMCDLQRYAAATVLDFAGLRRLTLQMCESIAYLHACSPRIVHCDVRPRNWLVHGSPEGVVVKLGGFDCAVQLDSKSSVATVLPLGSLYFSPPETLEHGVVVASSFGEACAVDVYGLALSVCEVAIGSFDGVPLVEDKPTRVARLVAHLKSLDAGFGGTIQAMLAVDPTARPTAAHAVAQLRGDTISVDDVTVSERKCDEGDTVADAGPVLPSPAQVSGASGKDVAVSGEDSAGISAQPASGQVDQQRCCASCVVM
jgi:serine/threonine protein kinase